MSCQKSLFMWTWNVLRCRFTSPQKILRPQETDDCECNTAVCIGVLANLAMQLGRLNRAANFPVRKLPSMHGRPGNVGCNPPRQKIHLNQQDVLLSIVFGSEKYHQMFLISRGCCTLYVGETPSNHFAWPTSFNKPSFQKLTSWRNISPVPIRNYDHHMATPDHLATQHHHHHQLQ